MNRGVILLLSLFMFGFAAKTIATSPEEYQDVKCFVQTSFGEEIAFFSWQVEELSNKTHQLAGKPIGKTKGVDNYVKEVIECVPMEKEFSSIDARKLDQNTLR